MFNHTYYGVYCYLTPIIIILRHTVFRYDLAETLSTFIKSAYSVHFYFFIFPIRLRVFSLFSNEPEINWVKESFRLGMGFNPICPF